MNWTLLFQNVCTQKSQWGKAFACCHGVYIFGFVKGIMQYLRFTWIRHLQFNSKTIIFHFMCFLSRVLTVLPEMIRMQREVHDVMMFLVAWPAFKMWGPVESKCYWTYASMNVCWLASYLALLFSICAQKFHGMCDKFPAWQMLWKLFLSWMWYWFLVCNSKLLSNCCRCVWR